VDGQEITMTEEPAGGGQVIDLMDALRASIEKMSPTRVREPKAERKPPKRAEASEAGAKKTAKK
jgi:DNA end-binding protein Ku